MEILQYTFFQYALCGSFLASIACAIVGTYIVSRRLVFISGGLTHASFGGIGIGLYSGLSPVLSAAVFAVLSAFGVQWLGQRRDMREDSVIAVFWTFGMSVGIICSYLSTRFTADLSAYLFGSILTITASDLIFLFVVTGALIAGFCLFSNQVIYAAFDREFAKTRGVRVALIEYIMMFFIAVTIVACLRMVGVVLAISMLTIPQMTANLFTQNFKKIVYLSAVIGYAGCIGGLAVSYKFNIPSGATIIFVYIIIYAVCKTCRQIWLTFHRHD